MNYDDYGEVVNGTLTYKDIADKLMDGKSVIIGWCDESYTHYDIYLSLGKCKKYGPLQRGIKETDLFVGIVGRAFFGFKADSEKNVGYYEEKLQIGHNECSEKLGELLNGVIKYVNKYRR